MSVRPNGFCICRMQGVGEDLESRALEILNQGRSFKDIALELVALRAAHNCDTEEQLASIREIARNEHAENERLRAELAAMTTERDILRAKVRRAEHGWSMDTRALQVGHLSLPFQRV